jgi:hypothetical protein
MKHILSIDFDIIMEPSIEFYNHMTRVSWEVRGQGNNYVNILTANYDTYYVLTHYILRLAEKLKPEQFHFIYDHHHLPQLIDPNESYVVTNIDHHHDKGYPQDGFPEISGQPLNCGNWINFVPNLKRFLWIKNPNSDTNFQGEMVDGINLADFNLDNLMLPDEVYICFSIPWVPPTQHPLFFLWMDLLNKHYNTHYNFEVPQD